jgi:hypothetical protein
MLQLEQKFFRINMTDEKEKYFKSRTEGLVDSDGIIVATNQEFEFLLPFWWMSYRKFNNLPITFIDYGMSLQAHLWCKQHGEVITLDLPDFLFEKRQINQLPENEKKWKKSHFLKAFALLQSPYQRTLWLDIDCEVRGNIAPLFPLAENPAGMALALGSEIKHEGNLLKGYIKPGEHAYNSGVIVFKRDCQIIKLWAQAVCDNEQYFQGDQYLLTRIIYDHNFNVSILPKEYNWRVLYWGINENALIAHWNGGSKKFVIDYIKTQPMLSQFLSNKSFHYK